MERNDTGKPKYPEKNLPQCPVSTINPTWTDPGSNTGLRGEGPATNRLSLGTAKKQYFCTCCTFVSIETEM
jgi:hypothetical protein